MVLALVMCVGLTAPAFASPSEIQDTDAATVGTPRYPIHQVCYKLYIGSATTIDIFFSLAEKNGGFSFESVDTVAWNTTNYHGLYWRVTDYTYRLSDNDKVCTLTIFRDEMHEGTPTGYSETMSYVFPVEDVINGNSRESSPAFIPGSGYCTKTFSV